MPHFRRKKRVVLTAFAAFALVCVALGIWSVFIEPNRLVVKEEALVIPQWPGAFNRLRIVLISDLHVGSPHINPAKLQQIVATINRQQPDLVLIAGDFVNSGMLGGSYVEPQKMTAELRNLRARDGIYAVLGNNDWVSDGPRIRRALDEAGIRVLENDVARLERDGQSLWIAGFADLWESTPRITETLARIEGSGPIIALTHNPDIFPDVPVSVSLTLAGHTHGGQVCLPLIGCPVVPSRYRQRYVAGLIRENNRQLFVTTGIGTSGLPLRFRVPPEIIVLTITSE